MAKTLEFAVKFSAVSAVAWLTFRWLRFFVPWASAREYLEPFAPLYVAAVLIAAVSASCAILLTTRQHFKRIMTNVLIIFASAAIGWWLGDPMAQGSYDHGWGESEQGWLVGGCLGAFFGYALTLMRYEFAGRKEPQSLSGRDDS